MHDKRFTGGTTGRQSDILDLGRSETGAEKYQVEPGPGKMRGRVSLYPSRQFIEGAGGKTGIFRQADGFRLLACAR